MKEPRNAGLCTHTHTSYKADPNQRQSVGVLGRFRSGDGEASGIYEIDPIARLRLYKIAHSDLISE
jgi:hypothetical protein